MHETSTGGRRVLGNEDWWAVAIGLAIVGGALVAHLAGVDWVRTLAVNPVALKWAAADQILSHFQAKVVAYVGQWVFWLVVFGIPAVAMGRSPGRFAAGFAVLYLLAVGAHVLGGWADASRWNLEPALVALVVGLALGNLLRLPEWLREACRAEFYVKVGIVLIGATFPLPLVVSAGPVALVQAAIISLATCLTIYFVATRLFGLDRRLAALLGTGGSVCGVSASLAVAASVGARREHVYTAVTLVVCYALVMVLVLPFLSRLLGLPAGVAGAWIGTSEFADAAGFAAASAYGRMAGNEEAALKAFTLTKVIGRDVWIGVWSLVWAVIATSVWKGAEAGPTGQGGGTAEIWRRFPKFVLGLFAASLVVTLAVGDSTGMAAAKSTLLGPIGSLRGWTFTFCFFSIGLATRFSELKEASWRSVAAFSLGVAVNLALGWLLSAVIFADHWARLG